MHHAVICVCDAFGVQFSHVCAWRWRNQVIKLWTVRCVSCSSWWRVSGVEQRWHHYLESLSTAVFLCYFFNLKMNEEKLQKAAQLCPAKPCEVYCCSTEQEYPPALVSFKHILQVGAFCDNSATKRRKQQPPLAVVTQLLLKVTAASACSSFFFFLAGWVIAVCATFSFNIQQHQLPLSRSVSPVFVSVRSSSFCSLLLHQRTLLCTPQSL